MATTELLDLVLHNQSSNMIVCEVGIGLCDTTVECLPIVTKNNGFMILIDDFSGGPGFENRTADMYKMVLNILKEYPNTIILEGKSWDMAVHIPNRSLDIVFIDADHKYSSVVKDIIAWAPKVKWGKILSGHDCNNIIGNYNEKYIEMDHTHGKHHGVVKAVSEMINNAQLINNCTWWTNNLKINHPNYQIEYFI